VPVPRFKNYRPASDATSDIKRKNRATNTKAEVALRRAVWRRGGRYRLHRRDLPGKPDLIFAAARVAVFVDGDFWHGRNWPLRRAKLAGGVNSSYWIPKIEANMARDARQREALEEAGWCVLRFWETDVLREPERIAALVMDAVRRRAP
jgi:DNA mismatch endonuclease, patch repair protein